MTDQQTCGKGLAVNAELPARLGELVAALAGVLEAHLPALDVSDQASMVEREVYLDLIRESQEAALQLKAIAAQMEGSAELPMGRHVQRAMAAPAALESFRRLVKVEEGLLSYLQRRIEDDRRMLIRAM